MTLPTLPNYRLLSRKHRLYLKKLTKSKFSLPLLITTITLLATFFLLTSLNTTPHAPRLRKGSDNVLFTAGNSIFSVNIGTRDGSPQVVFEVEDSSLTFTLSGINQVGGERLDRNTVLYENILPNTDLKYTTLSNGVKEEIIIKSPRRGEVLSPAPSSYLFDLDLTGTTPTTLTARPDGVISLSPTFTDSDGEYLFHFEEPFAYDAAGNRTDNVLIQIGQERPPPQLTTKNQELETRYYLKLTVDPTWLNDPSRTYPITIDPTIVHDTTTEFSAGTLDRVTDTGTGSVPSLETWYQELPADEHTVGLWHMNETAENSCSGGEDACDSSGNTNHGTATGTTIVDAKLSKGREFDGSSNYIDLDSHASSINPSVGTLSVWFKATSVLSSDQYITGSGDVTTDWTGLVIGPTTGSYTDESIGFIVRKDDSYQIAAFVRKGETYFADNQWHHATIVVGANYNKIYIDGIEQELSYTYGGSSTGNYFLNISNLDTLRIGMRPYPSSPKYFQGLIDEVRISNIARTPEEIRAAASRRPSSTYTSEVLDLTENVTIWNSLSWDEWGVATGDGETIYDDTDLVAQWNFNETSGTTADNAQGNAALDGTLSGFDSTASQDADPDSSWTANNKRWGAGALQFDGVDSYITITNTSEISFESTDTYSIETWFKTNTTTSGAPIIEKWGGSGGYPYVLRVNTATNPGVVYLGVYDGTNNPSCYSTSITNDNQWHHAVGIKNYTDDNLKLYVDGKLECTTTDTTTSSIANTANLSFGSRNGGSPFFSGTIDSTRIYSRALTEHEILSNYNSSNIQFQTRVGTDASPDDGSWDAWSSTTGETAISSFDGPFQYNTIDTGLIGYWPMDEITDNTCSGGEDACDASSSNHGTATGTTIVDGAYGKGRGFNGSSDIITISTLDLSSYSSMTIEAWIKPNDITTNTYYEITRQQGSGGLDWLLAFQNNGTILSWGLNAGGSYNELDTTITATNFTDGNWHHITAAYDGSNKYLYVDGVLLNSAADSGTIAASGTLNCIGSFGNSTSCDSEFFNGSIDEVRIYNSALSAATIQQHFLEGSTSHDMLHLSTAITSGDIFIEGTSSEKIETGRPQIDANTVALWHLDETNGDNAGDDVFDATSNNNDGEFNGTDLETAVINGVSGKGREFNGTDNFISVVDSDSLDTTGNTITLEAWVNPHDCTGTGDGRQTIVTKQSAYYLNLESTTCKPSFYWYDLTSPGYHTANSSISLNNWSYVVATYDGSSVNIYINGALNKSVGVTGTGAINTSQLVIGGASASSRNLDGFIDEVKVSNTARTPEEIAESYRMGRDHYINKTISSTNLSAKDSLPLWIAGDRPGTYLSATIGESPYANYQPDANTVGFWHFDDFRYKDSSGNNNDGTDSLYDIDYGIRSSNLTFIANQWNGAANDGEIDITCTGGDATCEIVTMDGATISTPSINYGVAMIENAAISAYIMYSPSLSDQGITPLENNSNNYVGIKYTGSEWQYDNNTTWTTFTPNSSNIIVASLTTGNPTVTNLTHLDFHMPSTQGKLGKAREFNGTSDYIQTTTTGFTSSSFTGEVWIKVNGNPGTVNRFLNYGTSGSNYGGWLMGIDTNGQIRTYTDSTGAASWSILTSNASVSDNNWHHVALSYDGTTRRIYIDGKLDNSSDYGYYSSPSSAILTIGKSTHSTEFFPGTIDEVRISNTARTASEIRQAYEVGLRTHPITIDFGATGNSGNLITSSTDYSFTVDATIYGLNSMGSSLYKGDKIIVRENYDGIEYIAQGTVTAITSSTGAVTVTSWDSGSTFPSGGYTANADFFKWQREYWPIANNTLSTHMDGITNLTLRLTNGSEGRTIWLDNLRSNSSYLTDNTDSTITSSIGNQYFQYRAIMTSLDESVSATLSAITLDYVVNTAPSTPSLDSPTDTTTNQSILPILTTTTTDADSDYLRYKIELCEDVGMSTNCQTFDQTSSQTGWSEQNTQTSTAYTSGTQATYTLQSILDTNTTYYWRSYAIDPGGTNSWSSTQGSPYSFTTTNAPTAPTTPYAEGATNPSGIIDTTPELSAIHNDPAGDSADYYQIEVNTSSDFSGTIMWDSTKTSMTTTANTVRSPDISYAGTTLSLDGSTYYWRIKFWDILHAEGAVSATANFTMNTSPSTPSLDSPTDTATNQSLLPVLKTTTTDADSDYLRYKIELCEDVGMSTSCQTFTQTAGDQTGWSGQNTQTSTAYTSGTQGVYTLQSVLDVNTTYYWRSYAIDPGGTNSWSSTQATPYSFTTTDTPNQQTNCRIQETTNDSSLTIIWTDIATNEDYYEIERSLDSAAWSDLITDLPANSTSHQDSTISTGHTYRYRIAPYLTAGPTYGDWCYTDTITLSSGLFNIGGINFDNLNLN